MVIHVRRSNAAAAANEEEIEPNDGATAPESSLDDPERGALAVGALAGGSVAGTSPPPTTDRTESSSTESGAAATSNDQLVLVSMADYRPEMRFHVVDRLPAPTTVALLRLPTEETVPVLTRPDEYRGYVVRSMLGTELVDTTTVVFTRDSLEQDGEYAFVSDASVFSERLNLFRASIERVDAEGHSAPDADRGDDTDE